jgi:hypothetical protein
MTQIVFRHTSKQRSLSLFHDPPGGISMVRAPSRHLTTRVVKDENSEDGWIFPMGGDKVAIPDLGQ